MTTILPLTMLAFWWRYWHARQTCPNCNHKWTEELSGVFELKKVLFSFNPSSGYYLSNFHIYLLYWWLNRSKRGFRYPIIIMTEFSMFWTWLSFVRSNLLLFDIANTASKFRQHIFFVILSLICQNLSCTKKSKGWFFRLTSSGWTASRDLLNGSFSFWHNLKWNRLSHVNIKFQSYFLILGPLLTEFRVDQMAFGQSWPKM